MLGRADIGLLERKERWVLLGLTVALHALVLPLLFGGLALIATA